MVVKRKQKRHSYLKKSTKRLQIQVSIKMRTIFKRILNLWKNHRRYNRMIWTDTQTDQEYVIDFVFVAFPGLQTMGYRVEGFHQTVKPCKAHEFGMGEFKEFGTLIISDGKLEVIQW